MFARNSVLSTIQLSTQVISRDHHAYLAGVLATVAATCERIATEMRALQKTDTLEAEEPFRKGQEGLFRYASQAQPYYCREDLWFVPRS